MSDGETLSKRSSTATRFRTATSRTALASHRPSFSRRVSLGSAAAVGHSSCTRDEIASTAEHNTPQRASPRTHDPATSGATIEHPPSILRRRAGVAEPTQSTLATVSISGARVDRRRWAWPLRYRCARLWGTHETARLLLAHGPIAPGAFRSRCLLQKDHRPFQRRRSPSRPRWSLDR